jgi:hypothetical protein
VAAGFDKSGPSLYWIDYLGNMEKMKTGGHGKTSLLRLRRAVCSSFHPRVRRILRSCHHGQVLPQHACVPRDHCDVVGRYYKPDCSLEEAVALMAKYILPPAFLASPALLHRASQVRDGGEPEVSRRWCALQVQSGGQGAALFMPTSAFGISPCLLHDVI